MTHFAVARTLLILLCFFQGLGTLLIDLGRTHATNSDWTRHARYHVVWQVISTALLALLEIALLLSPGRLQEERFYLAAILASIPMLSFFGALATRKRFGSALYDPNGIPPVRIVIFGSENWIDLSVVTESFSFTMLLAIVALFAY